MKQLDGQKRMMKFLRVGLIVAGTRTPESSIWLTRIQGADQARCTDSAAARAGQVVGYGTRYQKGVRRQGARWICTAVSSLLAGGGAIC
jgi:hypothetical protein